MTESEATVTVYANDLAGNESKHEKLSFKLDQNWFQRFYNNHKIAFFATIGGLGALIALIVFLIIRKIKK